MQQRVLVCGGRDYADRVRLYSIMDKAHEVNPITVLIHGAAKGADSLAADWAFSRQVPTQPYPAAWQDLSHPDALIRTRRDGTLYDARAGVRRNQRMLDEGKPDIVVAFPGHSGTDDMLRRARHADVPIVEVR